MLVVEAVSVPAWTPWQPLALASELPAGTLAEQLDGGQAFRWKVSPDGVWTGVFGQTLAGLRSGPQGLEWRGLKGAQQTAEALAWYLDAAGSQARLLDALPWRSDAVLRQAIAANPGLRILQQDPHEALLGFLCSSNKRILQIRVMVAALAGKLGLPVAPGYHALPGWKELAQADTAVLRSCALGYRAAFIQGTARLLAARPHWAKELAALPTPQLLEELQMLPGVGPKVAACVALFGFGRLESFPVDTWVIQALEQAYGLVGWKPAPLEQFGRQHFGAAAGLAQQYLFAAMRQGRLTAGVKLAPVIARRRPKPRG